MANDEIEAVLAKLWAGFLGVDKVGADDNFFALGGHSLLAIKLIAAVQEKIKIGKELNVSDLFEHPTLAEFSAHLKSVMAENRV